MTLLCKENHLFSFHNVALTFFQIGRREGLMRKDISKLERKMRNESVANKGLAQIRQKYKVQEKGLKVVIEELKQRVTAKASKLRRYDQRIKQYRQNRMFQCDQKRLYRELKGETVT